MNNKDRTLEELEQKASDISKYTALVGVDGFVDIIVHPVNRRLGQGDDYERIDTITDFGERVMSAAGKSSNIEIAPVVEKIGGNGPIMANAQTALGLAVRYIGALGEDAIHPVFESFAKRTNAVSIADPGITHALEFHDGKILMGKMTSLEAITYEHILDKMGEGAFLDAINRADLIAILNWTMIPNLTSVFNALLDRVLPNLGPNEHRIFFFDLCDPEKRSQADLQGALNAISKFQNHGHAILGLNLREAQQVDALLGFDPLDPEPGNLEKIATRIRNELKIGTVVIHPVEGAACANRDGSWYVEGPFCDKPKITTGAGDHFNAGFASAMLLGLSPEAALTVAVSTSGSYVRTAKSPSLSDIDQFIRNWD